MRHLFFTLLAVVMLIESSLAQGVSFNDDMSIQKPTFGHKAMVVTAEKNASEVGVQILKQGGMK